MTITLAPDTEAFVDRAAILGAALADNAARHDAAGIAVMFAKREIGLAGIDVCDLAMEVAGGSAFFRGSVIERCYRDIRASKFHPLSPEETLLRAGRTALGVSADGAALRNSVRPAPSNG